MKNVFEKAEIYIEEEFTWKYNFTSKEKAYYEYSLYYYEAATRVLKEIILNGKDKRDWIIGLISLYKHSYELLIKSMLMDKNYYTNSNLVELFNELINKKHIEKNNNIKAIINFFGNLDDSNYNIDTFDLMNFYCSCESVNSVLELIREDELYNLNSNAINLSVDYINKDSKSKSSLYENIKVYEEVADFLTENCLDYNNENVFIPTCFMYSEIYRLYLKLILKAYGDFDMVSKIKESDYESYKLSYKAFRTVFDKGINNGDYFEMRYDYINLLKHLKTIYTLYLYKYPCDINFRKFNSIPIDINVEKNISSLKTLVDLSYNLYDTFGKKYYEEFKINL